MHLVMRGPVSEMKWHGPRVRSGSRSTCFSFILLTMLMCVVEFQPSDASRKLQVVVSPSVNNYVLRKTFLSVATSPNVISKNKLNYGSTKLRTALEALAPFYIRIGGIRSLLTFFDVGNARAYLEKNTVEEWKRRFRRDKFFGVDVVGNWSNVRLRTTSWDNFVDFMEDLKINMVFELNYSLMKDGMYDTTYSSQFLRYNEARGKQVYAVGLINEPNSLGHKFDQRISVTPGKMLANLRNLRNKMDLDKLKHVRIVGPDVTSLNRSRDARQFLAKFLLNGGGNLVDEMSLHHYNLDGKTATIQDLMSADNMEMVRDLFRRARDLLEANNLSLPIVMTETACCFGGGSVLHGAHYVAGFMYLDLLGLAAKYGVTRVHRQTLIGAHYGLLDNEYNPRPDFFIAVLFKRLVEGKVLDVTLVPNDPRVRVYANCGPRDKSSGRQTSVVLYYLNLKTERVTLQTQALFRGSFRVFQLLPGDGAGLRSTTVAMKGKPLTLESTRDPSSMNSTSHQGPLDLPPESYGFIVGVVSKQRYPKLATYCKSGGPSWIGSTSALDLALSRSIRLTLAVVLVKMSTNFVS